MLYNTTHKLGAFIEGPTQEEIYNCPHYFAMSLQQIRDAKAPTWLLKVLDQFPFDGRNSIIQVRPQNFRNENIKIDGSHWHSDYNQRLIDKDGNEYKVYPTRHDDFHVMTVAWGAGPQTEFITTPMELPNNLEDWQAWRDALDLRLSQPYESMKCPKGQMIEYTSYDLHRADGILHSTGYRLIIIAFDNDKIEGNVRINPSFNQIESRLYG